MVRAYSSCPTDERSRRRPENRAAHRRRSRPQGRARHGRCGRSRGSSNSAYTPRPDLSRRQAERELLACEKRGGIAMNVRISLSVLVIVAAVIFFFFYTETGRLLLAAMGFVKPGL